MLMDGYRHDVAHASERYQAQLFQVNSRGQRICWKKAQVEFKESTIDLYDEVTQHILPGIPGKLVVLFQKLMRDDNFKVCGIFRKTPSSRAIKELRVDGLDAAKPTEIAYLIKQQVAKLDLLTDEIIIERLALLFGCDCMITEEKVNLMFSKCRISRKEPIAVSKIGTLGFLLRMLLEISSWSHENMMNASNLAIVFSPALLGLRTEAVDLAHEAVRHELNVLNESIARLIKAAPFVGITSLDYDSVHEQKPKGFTLKLKSFAFLKARRRSTDFALSDDLKSPLSSPIKWRTSRHDIRVKRAHSEKRDKRKPHPGGDTDLLNRTHSFDILSISGTRSPQEVKDGFLALSDLKKQRPGIPSCFRNDGSIRARKDSARKISFDDVFDTDERPKAAATCSQFTQSIKKAEKLLETLHFIETSQVSQDPLQSPDSDDRNNLTLLKDRGFVRQTVDAHNKMSPKTPP